MVETDALPDYPGTLKAMLLAERAHAERLEQIIKELRRHRFGRRAETLPEDQLQLGLEEVEQAAAAATRCIASARIAASGSTSSRRNCACSWCADPNMPAGPAKRPWCKRRPRRG
jgi:hypothetical protein